MLTMKKYFRLLMIGLVVSFIYSSIYTTAQQVLRQGANDPQIQLAEDTSAQLETEIKNKVSNPDEVIKDQVNIESSLRPFIAVYDKSGQVVLGSAMLNN